MASLMLKRCSHLNKSLPLALGKYIFEHCYYVYHFFPTCCAAEIIFCLCIMFVSTLSLPESIMETCSVVLTFESVDELLWCDHSNETSSAVLLNGTSCSTCFSIFYRMKIGILYDFLSNLVLFRVKALTVL